MEAGRGVQRSNTEEGRGKMASDWAAPGEYADMSSLYGR